MRDGRWRRIYSVEWHGESFQQLDNDHRVVWFYIKTGPQTTSVGCQRISTAVAVEDIGNLTAIEFDSRLDAVCQAYGWRFDPMTRLLWMPDWLVGNPPQSPNVCASWRKLLANLPDCDLKLEAITAIFEALKDYPEAFLRAFGDLSKDLQFSKSKPKGKTHPQTGAYQGSRDLSGSRGDREQVGAPRRAQRRQSETEAIASRGSLPAKLIDIARQTLQIAGPGDEHYLVDAIQSNPTAKVSRADAKRALQEVLAERRGARVEGVPA